MKVVADVSKCTGLGICESLAPAFFEIDDSGDLVLLREEFTEDERQTIEDSVSGCPTEALRIER